MNSHTTQAHTHKKEQRGFTLLFSVLVATLVVAIGATIISIAVRQTILSGTSRESQYAFYAANTVLECAVYWDIVGLPPGAPNPGTVFKTPGETWAGSGTNPGILTCAGEPLDVQSVGTGNESTFKITIKNKATIPGLPTYEYCADATVRKVEKTVGGNTYVETIIEARGRNIKCSDPITPRTVERGLIQSYQS